jgi:hypothetical protein
MTPELGLCFKIAVLIRARSVSDGPAPTRR